MCPKVVGSLHPQVMDGYVICLGGSPATQIASRCGKHDGKRFPAKRVSEFFWKSSSMFEGKSRLRRQIITYAEIISIKEMAVFLFL